MFGSITGRIFLGFGVITSLIIIVTIISIRQVTSANQQLETISEHNTVRQRYAINFRGNVHDRSITIRDLVYLEGIEEKKREIQLIDELKAFYASSKKPFAEALAKSHSDTEMSLINSVNRIEEETNQLVDAIINSTMAGDQKEAETLLSDARPLFVNWLGSINDVIDYYESDNTKLSNSAFATLDTFSQTMIITAVLAVIIAIIIASAIRRQISPITALQSAAQQLARGEAPKTLKVHREDELGILTQVVNEVSEASSASAQVAHNVANGDLRNDIALRSESDLLGKALDNMVVGMRDRMQTLSEITDLLNSSSQEITSASSDLSEGATNQAASIQEISASLNEIAAGTQSDTERAQQADNRANHAQKAGENGLEKIGDLDKAMDEIKSATTDITEILSSIDGIAFQTNLLALNAAVEAARAGRHGKGFAVVADEVRALAGRSAAAAKESAQKIELTGERVERGLQAAGAVTEALTDIAAAVSETARLVSEISDSTKRQATGIHEVREGLGQIEGVTQANTAQAEETNAASIELARTAQKLAALVGGFQLPTKAKIAEKVHESNESKKPSLANRPDSNKPKTKSQESKVIERTKTKAEDILPLGDTSPSPDKKQTPSGGTVLKPLTDPQTKETVNVKPAIPTKQTPRTQEKLIKPSPSTRTPQQKREQPAAQNDTLGWPESIPGDEINPADIIDLSDDSGRY